MKLKRSWSFGLLLSLTILVVSLSLVYFAIRSLAASRNDEVRQAEVHTEDLAQALTSQISAEIRQIEMALVTVASELERSLASGRLDHVRLTRFIGTQEKLLPNAVAIRVSNADGTVILNNPSADPSANFRDRPFWMHLRDHPEAGLFVSKPTIGLFTKQWVIHFSRRYNLPDGRFGGVVVAPVLVDRFQRTMTGFKVGPAGRITLRDNENGFVARYPVVVKGKTLAIGDREVASELQAIVASGVQQKTYVAVTPYDQTKRVFSFQWIQGIPLYVVVSLAEEDFLAQWHQERREVFIRLGISIFGFWLLAAFLGYFWLASVRDGEALFASRTQYRNLVENTKDLVTRVDGEGRLVFVNHAALDIFGLAPEACIGRSAFDFIAPEERKATEAAFASWLKTDEQSLAFENRQVGVGGQIHTIAWLITAELDENGRKVGFASAARDITERKQAEEALTQSQARHSSMVANISDVIGIIGVDGTMKYKSPNIQKWFGWEPQDLIGTDGWLTVHPDDLERIQNEFQTILEQDGASADVEYRYKCKDGSYKYIALTATNLVNDPIIAGVLLNYRDITQRKQAEEALEESQILQAKAQQMARLGFWSLNAATNAMTASDELLRILELRREDVSLEAFAEIIHPEDLETAIATLRRGSEEGRSYEIEHRLKLRDGKVKWVHTSGEPILDSAGKTVKLFGTTQDITERKQAKEKLEEMADRLTLASRAGGVGVWDFDTVHNRLVWDDQMYRLYGITEDQFSGAYEAWKAGLHPEDLVRGDAEIQMALRGEKEFDTEFRVVWPDGSIHFIRALAIVQRDASGQPLRMIGTNWDITENKQNEAYSKNEHDALEVLAKGGPLREVLEGLLVVFEALFPGVTGSVLLLDKDGRHLRHGAAPGLPLAYCQAIDGVEIGLNVGSCGTAAYTKQTIMVSDIASDPRWHDYKDLALAHGLKSCWSVPIFGTSGQVLGTFAFYFNTPRVALPSELEYIDRGAYLASLAIQRHEAEEETAKLQTQLLQSQKMESLGTLAGGVAHDMNNVLGAILGLASAHIGSQPYGSPLHQALDTICKATERGGKMVKSLLSFARQSPAENNKLDMNAILKEQIALLERTTLAKVRLEIDMEADLRPILGDASALTHAFMNLCVNAVDAMPENGTLTLHTRNVDNDWIEVVVEDSGTGMPKEVLEKAMEPFYTTKEIGKGTGLGLSMVFSTVKAHRGQMAIQSEPGHGTRVMLRFPACEQEAPVQAAALAATEATQIPHGTMKVLLIDDDDLIQSSVQAILEVLGHTAVTTAPSGEEALAMLEGGLEPDLVILDMNMPGLGGIGTLPCLRVLRPELPVLLATGRVDQTALTLASAHSGVTLLSKPFGLRELQKHLENIGLG